MALSIQFIGSVAMTSVAGLLTDRFGDKAVVLWSGAIMGVALILASAVQSYAWLISWLLVYGIGYAAVTPPAATRLFFSSSNRIAASRWGSVSAACLRRRHRLAAAGDCVAFDYRYSLVPRAFLRCSPAPLPPVSTASP